MTCLMGGTGVRDSGGDERMIASRSELTMMVVDLESAIWGRMRGSCIALDIHMYENLEMMRGLYLVLLRKGNELLELLSATIIE